MRRAVHGAGVEVGVLLTCLRHRAAYAPPRRQSDRPSPLGKRYVWQEHDADDRDRYDVDVREAHALLGTEPNDTLARIKINYLMRCRMFHPGAGGNPGMFYKITLAYERIMADRGVECRQGRIDFRENFGPRPDVQGPEHPLLEAEEKQAQLEPWAKQASEWVSHEADGDVKPAELEGATAAEMRQIQQLEQSLQAQEAAAAAAGASSSGEALEASGDASAPVPEVSAPDAAVATTPQPEYNEALLAQMDDPKRDVINVDSALHPDGGLVTITPPRTALFNQRALRGLNNDELMERWETAPEKLEHDEEEATAREIIERTINETGGALTKEQTEFMMTHLVERSDSVAGEAARAVTDTMNHVQERRQLAREALVLFVLSCTILALIWATVIAYFQNKAHLRNMGASAEYLTADTLLPWWGNDVEYERQVKRLFVEEWRRARSAARRMQTFQEGIARENATQTGGKGGLDAEIFEVTSERLAELRAKAMRGRKGTDAPAEAA